MLPSLCLSAGPVKFEGTDGEERAAGVMLDTLRGMEQESKGKPALSKALAKFSLEETGVAKVRSMRARTTAWSCA